MDQPLRSLPSVDEVLLRLERLHSRFPHRVLVSAIRKALHEARTAIRSGGEVPADLDAAIERDLAKLEAPTLRRVINATGVVLHTNLGRAPLASFAPVCGYSNLEYDLDSGARGRRDAHAAELLERLLGRPAIAVNNNAAAVFLVLHELARGGEVVVSRGELIEIGEGFRIPDIMAQSGAVLREVGTTNRTRIEDYRAAIGDNTRLLLRVHPSNFRISGFTARPSLEELAALGRDAGIPVYEDLGSGCVVDLRPFGIDEPLVGASFAAGIDLVSFSGDKLLGGPQAGILAGRPDLIARLRRSPLYRALRLDKLILQVLGTTARQLLLESWDAVPALRMIRASRDAIRERAARVLRETGHSMSVLVDGESVVGGGSTPEQALPTCLIAVAVPDVVEAERKLRAGSPPVIARIENGRLLLDLRTVFPEEEAELIAALRAAVR